MESKKGVRRITPLKFREKEQEKYFDANYQKGIDTLNSMSPYGEIHRKTPYDLSKKDDLIEAIIKTFCALMDLNHYYSELENIHGNYDETMELYEPKLWLYGEKGSNDYLKTNNALKSASIGFFTIVREKRNEFLFLIEKSFYDVDSGAFYEYLFNSKDIEIIKIDEFIDFLEEYMCNLEDYYTYSTPNQVLKLKELMSDALDDYLEELNYKNQ